MDPQACLDRAASALAAREYGEAQALLQDYRNWRVNGGFEPEYCGTRGLGGDAYARELFDKLSVYVIGGGSKKSLQAETN